MANPLLSASEALDLRKRVVAAEARADQAERDRDAAIANHTPGIGVDLDGLFAAIASQHFNAGVDDCIAGGLRAAFDAGWETKRERGDQLLAEALATVAERTRERDDAQLERDIAARLTLATIRQRDLARSMWSEIDATLTETLGRLERIRIAAGLPESYDGEVYEAGIIARLTEAREPPK